MDADVVAHRLAALLALEIERDGGLAYVNRLVHYSPEINTLLKRCGPGSKLTAFLEQRPSIFAVNRCNPHTVALVQPGAAAAVQCSATAAAAAAAAAATDQSILQEAALALEQRAIHGLRQRANKLARRHCGEARREQPPAAPLLWLVGKCKEELHSFVRMQSNRPVGVLIGTPEWKRLAAPGLFGLLHSSDAFHVQGSLDDEESNPVEISLSDDASLNVVQNPTAEMSDPVCERILALILAHKRGKVGGINVGRLLQDRELRDLLAGRDLQEYIRSAPTMAGQVKLFPDQRRDGAWYIQVLSSPSTTAVDEAGLEDGRCSSLLTDAVGSYSMTDARSAAAMANILANAVLASTGVAARPRKCVASDTDLEEKGKGGDAVACNMEPAKRRNTESPEGLHCIDLTAGVGGNTVACGKRFDSVLAFEIDASRADLLRKNVAAAALERTVTVKCGDSLAALPELADTWEPVRLCTSGAIAAILDPPWGGIHYKRRRLDHSKLRAASAHTNEEDEGGSSSSSYSLQLDQSQGNTDSDLIAEDEGLTLGGVPLSGVVALVGEHLANVLPVYLGVKLPLTFDVTKWKARLESAGELRRMHTTVESIKKLGRQLFVVVHINRTVDPPKGPV
jgi:predicted RNA methylase